jgi:multiple sugar transport system substrate-binding protein
MHLRHCWLVALVATVGASGSAVAQDGFWTEAAKPYEGVTIRGVSESTPPSNYVKDVLAPQFTEQTGINVEFEVTSWDQMFDKAIKDMEANTGIYDFVYIEQDIIYSYLARDFLVDLSQQLTEHGELKAPDFDFDAFTSFIDYFKDPESGDVYGVPMEAFIKVYLYRKDLFENPDAQAAFKEKYGYDLAPASTHDQHRDIAEFFTQWGEDNDLELWGTTVQAVSGHPASFYEFFETIAPSFGVYNWGINLETGGASVENGGTLNSDKAKAALEFWLGLLKYAPPEATSSTWDEVAASFAAGRAAQGWVYGRTPPGLRPMTAAPTSSARSAWRCRRPPRACSRRPRPTRATSATTTAAPSAFHTRRRTRKRRCCGCSTSASPRSRRTGRSRRRGSYTAPPTTIPRSRRWIPRSTATSR